jgi:phosphatidyl-myo-inositol alpha-mannosyltransferase
MAQENRSRLGKRVGLLAAVLLVAGIIALGIADLGVPKVLHTLGTAKLGWVAIGVALMMLSLLLRAVSWHEILRAALPAVPIRWPPVLRATMIGVMGSAVFPGRLGEAARVLVLSRHLPGRARDQIALVAGTVFSQTLINLLALAILALVTFSSVPVFQGHASGLAAAATAALAIVALVIAGPRLLTLARRSRSRRISELADAIARLLALARQGLAVFARPRHGAPAGAAQLSAWGLQWLSCYAILLALSLQHKAGLVAAAAVLLAVNLSAVLPPTPANIGVFQAACLVVLTAFGVGAGPGLAYGILLQAVEVSTALALGTPALLGEGMRWRDVRRAVEQERAGERTSYPLEDAAQRYAERERAVDRALR